MRGNVSCCGMDIPFSEYYENEKESIFPSVIKWKDDCSEVGDNDGYARTETDDL